MHLVHTYIHTYCPVEYSDCREVRPPNECPDYDTKQFDGEVPVMQGFGGMRSTPSLPLLPGSLGSEMVAPDWALSMSLNRTKLHTYVKVDC